MIVRLTTSHGVIDVALDVRRLGARVLANSPDPRAVVTLTTALNDEDAELRREAAAALAARAEAAGRRVIRYGAKGTELRLDAMTPQPRGLDLRLTVHGRSFDVALPLAGAFQAANALCALGLVLADDTQPDADRMVWPRKGNE